MSICCVLWGKHSAWQSTHYRAEARAHYPQRIGVYKAPLRKGRLWQIISDKKTPPKKFLGGVRVFSAKNAEVILAFYFLFFI